MTKPTVTNIVNNEFSSRFEPANHHFAIVVSRYNRDITDRLLRGSMQTLADHHVADSRIKVAPVPGAWELPLATKWLLECEMYSAIICLGAVIRGETSHDEHLNRCVSQELASLSIEYEVPIAFGLLTCHSFDQANDRAGGAVGNKGVEAARAALEMLGLQHSISHSLRQS